MSDDEQLLRDELEASSERIGFLESRVGYLKEQIKTLEVSNEMYRRLAERRFDEILDLEEEVATLRENLDNLETQIGKESE
jgi:polyhydroxyalkanoate synthesis regulator phasin